MRFPFRLNPEGARKRQTSGHLIRRGRRWPGALALAVLLILSASAALYATRNEAISILWRQKANRPQSLTIAPGGQFFGGVDEDGLVRLYDEHGDLLWTKKIDGATDVLVARSGQSMLVYSRLNPIHRTVRFYRRDGSMVWSHEVQGSVWAGAVTPDGQYAAVTTGERFLYRYTPHPSSPKFRRWRLKGIGHCLAFTPDSNRIVVGTWQDSTIACYDLEGSAKWLLEQETKQQYELHLSTDGRHILGVRPGTQHTPSGEICLWDSDGQGIWQRDLSGYDIEARISPQSRYVAVSYATILKHKNAEIVERKVAVYAADGRLSWEKGGLFFGPRLVALSPTGDSVIVSDGNRSLYNMDRSGRILSKRSFRAKIEMTASSDDGRRILIYCSDGSFYLLGVG